jgi:hypothetical protein
MPRTYPTKTTFRGRDYYFQSGKISGWDASKCEVCSTPVNGQLNIYYNAGSFVCGDCVLATPTSKPLVSAPNVASYVGPEPVCSKTECPMLWGAGVSINHKKGCAWVAWNTARKAP